VPENNEFAENVRAIDTNLTRLKDENYRLRQLVSDAYLLVACQPENRHTAKWLQEAKELRCG
jgi:hypothetical protein